MFATFLFFAQQFFCADAVAAEITNPTKNSELVDKFIEVNKTYVDMVSGTFTNLFEKGNIPSELIIKFSEIKETEMAAIKEKTEAVLGDLTSDSKKGIEGLSALRVKISKIDENVGSKIKELGLSEENLKEILTAIKSVAQDYDKELEKLIGNAGEVNWD